ncbi:MAG: extracellular solute-binding protein, partial [Rhodospirillales bacterium]|nr:extracellular solute-binding protein [Rhodospirillales bacterium]
RRIDGVEIDGKVYMVPVDWGNTAVIYRTDQVKLDNKSIKFLTDPAYKGRISIPDGVDDVYAMAALLAGIKDHLNMTDAQFKAATDALRAVAKNVRFYWSDATQLNQALAAGEVVAALAWNESLLNLKGEGVPVEMMFDAKEGVSTWVCGFVLLNDAPGSEDHAYDYINAFMEAQSGKYMIEAWGYGHANGEAFSAASKESLETLGFGDFRAFIKNSLFQGAINPALKEKMIAEFEKIKAGF